MPFVYLEHHGGSSYAYDLYFYNEVGSNAFLGENVHWHLQEHEQKIILDSIGVNADTTLITFRTKGNVLYQSKVVAGKVYTTKIAENVPQYVVSESGKHIYYLEKEGVDSYNLLYWTQGQSPKPLNDVPFQYIYNDHSLKTSKNGIYLYFTHNTLHFYNLEQDKLTNTGENFSDYSMPDNNGNIYAIKETSNAQLIYRVKGGIPDLIDTIEKN